MGGKVILLFLVALCVAQEFHAASIEPRGIIEEIMKEFKEIISNIKNAIIDNTVKIPEIIEDIKNKIKQSIDNFNIMDLIKNIKDTMQEILEKAGLDASVARECLDSQDPALEKLNNDTTETLQECKIAAETQIKNVEATKQKLHEDAQKLLKFCNDGNDACVKEHGLHLIKVANCLATKVIPEVKVKVANLVKETAKLIMESNEAAIQVPVNLTKCMATCSSNFIKGQEEIIKNFTECLSNISKPTEKPTEPTTVSTTEAPTEPPTVPSTEATTETTTV